MNLLQQFWAWLKSPTAAQSQTGPTIGDQLLRVAADYLRVKTAEAQQKANAAVTTAPAENAPGATQGAADAPMGQTLADLLAAYNRK